MRRVYDDYNGGISLMDRAEFEEEDYVEQLAMAFG